MSNEATQVTRLHHLNTIKAMEDVFNNHDKVNENKANQIRGAELHLMDKLLIVLMNEIHEERVVTMEYGERTYLMASIDFMSIATLMRCHIDTVKRNFETLAYTGLVKTFKTVSRKHGHKLSWEEYKVKVGFWEKYLIFYQPKKK
jgi:hypothetical protein